MHHKNLTSALEVINALGGYKAVCALTKSAYQTVHRWGRVNHFPSRFYRVMLKALEMKGATAPDRLWHQDQDTISQIENTQHTPA